MHESPQNNVVNYLAQAAQRVGARTALSIDCKGHSINVSFAELWERVVCTSAGLCEAGLAAGDRVILMIPMSIDLYTAMLAVLKIGAIGVFIDPWIGRRQIAAFAAYAEPGAWIGNAKSHLLRLSEAQLRRIGLTVTTGNPWFGLAAQKTLGSFLRFPSQADETGIFPVAADSPALITFTSGSSGAPKGTNRTHGFLAAQHAALSQEFPLRDDDIDMTMFPIFALNNLANGITSVIPEIDFRHADEVDGTAIVVQMVLHSVTTCTASPTFIDRVVEHLAVHSIKPRPLRRILTGGAPVTDRQLAIWRRVLGDVEIVVVYGSTEAEPVAHITAAERLSITSDVRPSTPGYCVGKPSPLIDVRTVRITHGPIVLGASAWADWEVAASEIGELVVCGGHVARDYYRNPAAVAENKITDSDGAIWHRMGDTGYFDASGRLWLVGRVHSTIFRDGVAIHPQLVEQAAAGNDPRIRHVAALGLPDAALGERLVIIVETDDIGFEDGVRARVTAVGLPVDEVRLTKSPLPLDPRHRAKIDYAKLREQLRTGRKRFKI